MYVNIIFLFKKICNDKFFSVTGHSIQKNIVKNDLLQKNTTCYTIRQTSTIFLRRIMKKYTLYIPCTMTLKQLHQVMYECYTLFQMGLLSEKEYLAAIKPLDMAIDTLEMSTLKEFLVLREASLAHFHVPEK
jgi:hypothetical protein